MNSWRDDLIKKANKINLKGGDSDGSICNRSNSWSSNSPRSTIPTKTRKDITNGKGKETNMITREAALEDLEKLEAEATDGVSKVVVKVAKVLVKLLTTIRTNQLLTDADKVAIKKAKESRKTEKKG